METETTKGQCDMCEEPYLLGGDDHNGETGNHYECEPSTECRYCRRVIVFDNGIWVDPNATGDDEVWWECCDSHSTFEAAHEPYTEGE